MSVTHDEYRRARAIAEDASGVLLGAMRPSRRGRPTTHPRIFLTGLILAIDTYGSATVAKIHYVLTHDLPRDEQWDLGVLRRDASGRPRALTLLDLYNFTRRVTQTLNHTKTRAGDLEDVERYRRRAALDDFTAAFLDPTLIPRPDGAADFALDGSGLWAAEKAKRALTETPAEPVDEDEEPPSVNSPGEAISPAETTAPAETADEVVVEADPSATDEPAGPGRGRRGASDAAYGVKTAKSGKREGYFGYDVEAIVRVPEKKADDPAKRSEPLLIERLVVLPASTDVVGPILAMIDRMRASGTKMSSLLVDRHYSYKRFDRWLMALLARGIRQVADMHENDQGFRDWDGIKIAAGWAHCPCTPDNLGTIPTLPPDPSEEAANEFHERIAKREAYAAQRVSRLNSEGKVRFACPARNGTLGCPLVPGSVATATANGLPIISNPPDEVGRPSICTQDTVQLTIKSPLQARAMKLHQTHYWGSRAWRKAFNRRTYVEGFFGVLKSATATGLDRGTHQFVGLPLVTIVVTAAAAVTNMRLLRTWHAQTGLGDETHPLLQPDQPFHGFAQLSESEAHTIDQTCSPEAVEGGDTGPLPTAA
jgi:hypothetical protein